MQSPLKTLPLDKVAHFLTGGFIFAMLHPFGAFQAFVIVGIIAAAKEIVHDSLFRQGTPDVWDFVWTLLGAHALWTWMLFVVPFLQSFKA